LGAAHYKRTELAKIALVFVRFDHVASRIVNVNHSVIERL
jgi:hypothetical protein